MFGWFSDEAARRASRSSSCVDTPCCSVRMNLSATTLLSDEAARASRSSSCVDTPCCSVRMNLSATTLLSRVSFAFHTSPSPPDAIFSRSTNDPICWSGARAVMTASGCIRTLPVKSIVGCGCDQAVSTWVRPGALLRLTFEPEGPGRIGLLLVMCDECQIRVTTFPKDHGRSKLDRIQCFDDRWHGQGRAIENRRRE